MKDQHETLDPLVQQTINKLRDGEQFRLVLHGVLAASLLGAFGAYAFDAHKIGMGLGCIAFYLAVELICGVLLMGQDRMFLINYINMGERRKRYELPT